MTEVEKMDQAESEKTVKLDQDNVMRIEELSRTTGKPFEETVNTIIRSFFKAGYKTSRFFKKGT
jgi:tRNA A37 N6-isopentenylltransferase MiaA